MAQSGGNIVTVIVLAGGTGERFGNGVPKQFLKIAGRRVIEHTLAEIEASECVREIVVVSHKEHIDLVHELVRKNRLAKVVKIVIGGDTRQQSSWQGLLACSSDTSRVLIHDAARPFVTRQIIKDVVEGLADAESTDPVIKTADTIIRADPALAFIETIPDRSVLFRGQSPQGFRFDVIKRAHELAREEGYDGAPDDCSLILRYKLGRVRLVPGAEANIKITHPIDSFIADKLFQIRTHEIGQKSRDQLRAVLGARVLAVFGIQGGIGRAIANVAETLGMQVHGWGRDVNVQDYDVVQRSLQSLFEKTGRIDHVVNAAGLLRMAHVERSDVKLLSEQIGVNLLGSVNVCKASIGFLRATGGHVILFTSSSYTRGREGYTAYSASKAAVVNFAQGFSDEMSDYDIKVNCINPERTATPMRQQNFGHEDEGSLLRAETVAIQCLNVMASAITGSVIDVRKIDEARILEAFGL